MSNENTQTFANSTGRLYLNAKTADVFFLVDDGNGGTERIPGHKCLMAALSHVFETMFYGSGFTLKQEDDIRILNTTADLFKTFLRFAYFSYVDLTIESAIQLMEIGDMYNVESCIEACVNFCKENVTSYDVCSVLNAALIHSHKELETICSYTIAMNASEVFKVQDFLECDQSVLEYILRMTSMCSTETEVFNACMSWVSAKSKQEVVTKDLITQYLGNLFYEIRFASMVPEEFADLCNLHSYAFTSEELMDIVRGYNSWSGYPLFFNGDARHFRTDQFEMFDQTEALPVTATKDWHHLFEPYLRNDLVVQFIRSISPAQNVVNIPNKSFHNWVMVAKDMERAMYAHADSETEYYDLFNKWRNEKKTIDAKAYGKHT